MNIFCCECDTHVGAELVDGSDVYPHRPDLFKNMFWRCGDCLNFVGTHKHSKDHAPLGVIVNKQVKQLRIKVHAIIDPIWKEKLASRRAVYSAMSIELGINGYHTANIKSVEDGQKAIEAARSVSIQFKRCGMSTDFTTELLSDRDRLLSNLRKWLDAKPECHLMRLIKEKPDFEEFAEFCKENGL